MLVIRQTAVLCERSGCRGYDMLGPAGEVVVPVACFDGSAHGPSACQLGAATLLVGARVLLVCRQYCRGHCEATKKTPYAGQYEVVPA